MSKEVIVNLRIDGVTKTVKDVESLNKEIELLNETLSKQKEGTLGFTRASADLKRAKEALSKFNTEVKGVKIEDLGNKFKDAGQKMADSFNGGINSIRNLIGDSELLQDVQQKGGAILEGLTGAQSVYDSKAVKSIKGKIEAFKQLNVVKKLFTFVTNASSLAMKGFRLALISTGIGAIIVAVGTLVANWDRLKESFTSSEGRLNKFTQTVRKFFPLLNLVGKGIDKLREKFGSIKAFISGLGATIQDFFIATGDAIVNILDEGTVGDAYSKLGKKAGENWALAEHKERFETMQAESKKRIEQEIKNQERLLEIARAGGEDTVELERKILLNKASINKDDADKRADSMTALYAFDAAQKKKAEDEKAKIDKKAQDEWLRKNEEIKAEQERINEEKIAREKELNDQLNQAVLEQGKTESELKRMELDRQLEEYQNSNVDQIDAYAWYLNEIQTLEDQDEETRKEKEAERQQKELERADNLFKLKQELAALQTEETFEIAQAQLDHEREVALRNEELTEEERLTINKIYAEKQKQLAENKAKAEKDVRKQVIQNDLELTKNALSAVAGLFEGNFKVQKAVGIATATIDTFIGAQKAFSSQFIPGDPSSFVRAGIAAATSIAQGIARVKKITSTNIGSGSSGGDTGGGGGSFISTGSQQTQEQPQIDLGFLGQGDTQSSIKAYVVESEISTETAKAQKLEELTVL